MSKKIYWVRMKDDEGPGVDHLVVANNASQAVRHVTRELFDVKLATPEDSHDLGSKGIQLEYAKKDEE